MSAVVIGIAGLFMMIIAWFIVIDFRGLVPGWHQPIFRMHGVRVVANWV